MNGGRDGVALTLPCVRIMKNSKYMRFEGGAAVIEFLDDEVPVLKDSDAICGVCMMSYADFTEFMKDLVAS
jgi:hypothetical protein